MKVVAALMLMAVVSFSTGCGEDPTNINVNENVGYDIPEVETSMIQEITETSALGGGVVTSSAGGQIIERGLCWGTETNPSVSGSHVVDDATGAGSFTRRINGLEPGTLYHVRAYAINSVGIGYGEDVFFITLGVGSAMPEGAINGVFSVSNSKKVYFSKGNLQYNKTTQEWSFVEHQYDMVERDEQNVGENYSNQNIVSLFGYGTSGYMNKYPYVTTTDNSFYVSYGLYSGGMYYDWGAYNRISNGGGQAGIWRTLKSEEWEYVFNQRMTSSGIRYAKGVVNGTKGIILLPDGWSSSVFTLSQANIHDAPYSSNRIDGTQWSVLENAGAVFLPAAGYRINTTPTGVGTTGTYMSSSTGEHHCVLYSSFYDYGLSPVNESYYYESNGYGNFSFPENYIGRSVRLVSDVE